MINANLKLTQVFEMKGIRVNDILEFLRTQIRIDEYISVFKKVKNKTQNPGFIILI